MKTPVSGILLFSVSLCVATAGNWPAWRGPGSTGVADAGTYPVSFSAVDGVVWRLSLPGRGASTPAVWEDSIFLTAGVDGSDTVMCIDTSGRERWRKALGSERPGKHREASGSNPSPVTDGHRVFVYFKSGTLAAIDFAGDVAWQINLQKAYGRDRLGWDLGTSPVLTRDAVVVGVMQNGGSYLVALDKTTGAEMWKTDRDLDAPDESNDAYTTPLVVRSGGTETILTWGADHLTAHDARTGDALWFCGGFNPESQRNWRTIASAVAENGIALVPYGRGAHLAGVRIGGEGDVTDTGVLWRRDIAGPDVPTPAVRDGRAYVLSNRGDLTCVEIASGRDVWTFSLPRARDNYFASPVLAGDQLYCARLDGTVMVGRVSDSGFELLAENAMGTGMVGSPVAANGRLFLRGANALFCVGTE